MSRARPIVIDGTTIWFDIRQNHKPAAGWQLELLAATEDIDLDDLLDESVTQADVLYRLRKALNLSKIPPEVEARRQAAKLAASEQPKCRVCGMAGNSTKHHFVNRWIMRELSNYPMYAARTKCTIPVCVDCHRKLHWRQNGPKHIVDKLTADEKALASSMLEDLHEERPVLFELLAKGSTSVYESALVQDYIAGKLEV